MTPLSQSREDAQELNEPLMTPRTQIRIGNWNVRTMYTAGKLGQAARVMNQMKIHIMGISECRWTGAGRMKLSSGETVLYPLKQGNNTSAKTRFYHVLVGRYSQAVLYSKKENPGIGCRW